MRSLYNYDIIGAKPTIRNYQKSLIRKRNIQQIDRFSNLNQKRYIDWYQPSNRHVEPIQNQSFPLKTTSFDPKTFKSSSHSFSNTRIYQVAKKVTQIDSPMTKSSILSQTGSKSLAKSEMIPEYDYSPYFPHKYRDYDRQYPNKWSGTRQWKSDVQKQIKLPQVSSQYYPKWD